MSKRTGYLASVAMPLISMSLMVPHAQAMPNMPQLERAYGASDIIRVQDAVSPPPAGAESEEELKKRRAPPAAEEQHQKAPPEAKPEARPEPKPEPKPEPAPAAEPRAAAPPREAPTEPKAPPAAREPAAAEPKAAEPKAREPKAPEPKAPEPKAPEPRAKEPVAPDGPAARPQPPEPKPSEAKPAREKPPEPRPAPEEKPAPAREKPAAEPETQSRPAPVEAPPAAKPAPEKKPAAGEAPRQKPTDAQKLQPEAGEAPAPATRPATPLSGEPPAPAARPAAPAPDAPAPVPGAKAPAVVAPDAQAPAAGQTPGQPLAPGARPVPPALGEAAAPAAPNVASPTTPEQVERARKIAENPAASNQPIVLPVENGAAVLDSAKEAPAGMGRPGGPRDGQPRDGQSRDGQRRDGGPQAGQPGAQPQPLAPNTPPPPPPRSDADAQAGPAGRAAPPVRMEAITSERGERMRERPRYDMPAGFDGRDVGGPSDDGRIIINFDNRTIVRHDDSRRFYDSGYTPEYERLPGGRTREIIARDNGVQIVTIRDRYGDVVQRSRIGEDGREYVLFYAPEQRQDRGPDYEWRDPADDLPPMRLTVPVSQYIIDTSTDPDRDYYKFLEQPPVERVERVYSLDEVRYSARIRDKVRRIDLDTITFATGSADIPMNQARSLRKVADAINEVLKKDPSETFLIEGHTDAVGSDESNLVLSDRRAEQVAVVLSDVYGIPPENMTTQGYGERYLKVNTAGPSQENRRVTIRRITALVKPVAQTR